MTIKPEQVGSSFDSWLEQEGIFEEVTATAIERVLARQVADEDALRTLLSGGPNET